MVCIGFEEFSAQSTCFTANPSHARPPHAVFHKVAIISGLSFHIPKSSEASIVGSPGVINTVRPLGNSTCFMLDFAFFPAVGSWLDKITLTAINNCSSVVIATKSLISCFILAVMVVILLQSK
jgi:hypothetical protein